MEAAEQFRTHLLQWFDHHRRDLPWRRTRDPYAILVSEVMLQQTRVETVIPYFARFLARFPDAAALATASLDDVLSHWAGLGYYRRARLLKRAAETVVGELGGAFPRTAAELEALPGIGRYTAGAIASIAFGESTPLVDGNVARVLCRVDRIAGDWRDSKVARRLWERAGALVPAARAGDFNQALMELGATVCTPANPRCDECPIARNCAALHHRAVDRFPSPRARRDPVAVRLAACIVRDGSRVAIVRRDPNQRMAGLHDVPAIELAPDADAATSLRAELATRFGLETSLPLRIGSARHSITHHKIAIEVFSATLEQRVEVVAVQSARPPHDHGIAARCAAKDVHFAPPTRLQSLGFSALGKKVLKFA